MNVRASVNDKINTTDVSVQLFFFCLLYKKYFLFNRAGVGFNEVAKNNNLNQKDNLANVEGDFKNLALQFSLGYRF